MSNAEKDTSIPPAPSAAATRAIATLTDAMNLASQSSIAFDDVARALPIFDHVPPGHAAFQVKDDCHEPHLHQDEWCVIDATARELVPGELHVLLQSNGPTIWQVTRCTPRMESRIGPGSVMLHPLNRSGLHLSEGPVVTDYVVEGMLGRVVGILDLDVAADRRRARAVQRLAERAKDGRQ